MSRTTIINGTVVLPDGIQQADLVIEDGLIADITESAAGRPGATVIDAAGMLVLPGAIDIHFHCRAPAKPERGDFATETRAAAAGGVTTIFEMPISNPGTATEAIFNNRRAIGERDAYVDFGLYAAPASLDPDEIRKMVEAGAIGFKTFMTATPEGRDKEFEGLCAVSEDAVYQVLELTKPYPIPAVFHAESNDLLGLFQSRVSSNGPYKPKQHGDTRPAVVESVAIAMLAAMADDVGRGVHVAHLSTAAGLNFVRDARRRGVPMTSETCPHFLLFTEEILQEIGPFGLTNPPLRSPHDRDALWAGLDDGTIEIITTDHSPATEAEKASAWDDARLAPPGAPSVEFLYPFVIDQALRGRFTLNRAVDFVATRPARMYGLYPHKGVIQIGAQADLVVLDPEATTVVDRHQWHSKSALADRLYTGRELKGKLRQTLLRGQVIVEDNQILGKSGDGRFVRPITASVATNVETRES